MQDGGLHRRTAKSAEKVAATARAPGAGVQTTASRQGQRPLADFAEPPQSKRRVFLRRKSEVFCARSASDADDTRGFSPCLTFWYFWGKPKVQRKTVADFLSAQSAALSAARAEASARGGPPYYRALRRLRPVFLAKSFPLFLFRKRQRRPRGENGRESAALLAERSRKTTLIARSFRTLGARWLLYPTFSHRGIEQAVGLPRNTPQSVRDCDALAPRRPKPPPMEACSAPVLRKVPSVKQRLRKSGGAVAFEFGPSTHRSYRKEYSQAVRPDYRAS